MKLPLLIAFVIINSIVYSQPFIEEIEAFKRQDSISAPPKNAVLFVGSSSFRMWDNLQQDFPKYKIINRGFGGSTFNDLIRYTDVIVLPYKPKQIVIYCGDNDIAAGVSPEETGERFDTFVKIVRSYLPGSKIIFVSIKPSPKRLQFEKQIMAANAIIKSKIERMKKAHYVDIHTPMLSPEGTPRQELFTSDDLHINEAGYALWQQVLKPVLAK